MEISACPECGRPAEVITAGRGDARPGDIVGVRCIDRHWFYGPRERLVAPSAA